MNYLQLRTNPALGDPLVHVSEAFRARLQYLELPSFQTHHVDIQKLEDQLEKYQKYSNIIFIGNGGSRTSALALWQSLAHKRNKKNIEFLSTMEPDVIVALKEKYHPEDTLVVPISKSGTNVDLLEPLFQFLDYPILPITSQGKGVLYEMAKIYGWDIVNHPEVGGRYSGRTECALAPALLMGLDVEKIDEAAQAAYARFDYRAPIEQNIALHAAAFCYGQEQNGITEIFMPVYSVPLSGFLPLIVQLLHESTGKNGKGQTLFGDQAPESQHHTNQRFFGGRKNVMGWFLTVKHQRANDIKTSVPEKIQDFALQGGTIRDIDNIPLADALRFDYEGVAENATRLGIPHITLEIDALTEESVGELLSFLHYSSVYAALLRDQNPFDQPAVEDSKIMSFKKRQAYRS